MLKKFINPLPILCLVLVALTLRLAMLPKVISVEAKGTPLPIIMYHSILKDKSLAGDYIVSPDILESDFKYLKENGYTAILANELVDMVVKGETMPQKPVIITFDDGYLNNLTYALPLLEEYDMKAVISVVGTYSENFSENPDANPSYSHLSWEDIKILIASGRIEIANHSYNMHSRVCRQGIKKLKEESASEYYCIIMNDIGKTQSLLEANCNVTPTTFAYPYGYISSESVAILQEMGFTALLTCTEKVNYINTGDNGTLLSLGRFNRPSNISTKKFMEKIQVNKAK